MPAFLGSKYRVFWSKMETVDTIDEIQHAGVRGCLRYLGIDDGIEVNHAGDLPARSGLGSSSAFTVGMLHALHAMQNHEVSKGMLADEAIEVEQKVLGETVGVQDQIQCAYGGFNYINIRGDGAYEVHPLHLTDDWSAEFAAHLMLVFTGIQRHASEIAKAQMTNADNREGHLHKIVALVPDAMDALARESAGDFGKLLHDTWQLKRELSDKVTNSEIDSLYEVARSNGAMGGKLLGAGGGGFMLLFAPPEKHQQIKNAMNLITAPVRFENHGTQLVLS